MTRIKPLYANIHGVEINISSQVRRNIRRTARTVTVIVGYVSFWIAVSLILVAAITAPWVFWIVGSSLVSTCVAFLVKGR